MARRSKSETWSPTQSMRIRAFARMFASKVLDIPFGQLPKVSDLQNALSLRPHSLIIPNSTFQGWINGEHEPKTYVSWIKRNWPGCVEWLDPNVDFSPMHRFLSALDVWGSPIDDAARSLSKFGKIVTVGKGLSALASHWSSVPITEGEFAFCGYAIPRLKCHAPRQVDDTVYQLHNPLSLMDYMFRSGPYLDMSAEELRDWAIDLASLTLFVSAYFQGTSLPNQIQAGRSGDYSALVFDIFFRSHGNWPNTESVKWRLEDFSEFEPSIIDSFAQRLLQACDVLKRELHIIGSDLSIVDTLSGQIKDHDKFWQQPLSTNFESFDSSKLIQPKRNNSPAAPGRYKYEFKMSQDGSRQVICYDLCDNSQTPLTKRRDLFHEYEEEFSWGYSGEGPKYLTRCVLAHHLGHSDFGSEEVERLLKKYISRIPGKAFDTSFILTTQLIDAFLNE